MIELDAADLDLIAAMSRDELLAAAAEDEEWVTLLERVGRWPSEEMLKQWRCGVSGQRLVGRQPIGGSAMNAEPQPTRWQPRWPIVEAEECVKNGGIARRLTWGDGRLLVLQDGRLWCVGRDFGSAGGVEWRPSAEDCIAADWVWKEFTDKQ